MPAFRRDVSSACHTEYDNAESEGNCSESEMLDGPLEQLKEALRHFYVSLREVERVLNSFTLCVATSQ